VTKLRIIYIDSHKKLQQISDILAGIFDVENPFALRSAILEVVQNTIQHSDGRFALEINKDRIIIINLVKENDCPGNGLGLRLYSGIFTEYRRRLFYSMIIPKMVRLKEMDIEAIMCEQIL